MVVFKRMYLHVMITTDGLGNTLDDLLLSALYINCRPFPCVTFNILLIESYVSNINVCVHVILFTNKYIPVKRID